MAPPFGSVTTCRIDPTGGTKQQSTSDNDDAPPAPKDAHFGIKRSLLSQLWEVRLYRRGVTHRRCFSAARYGDMDQALAAAQSAVDQSLPHEMLLLDLYGALRPLDAVTGETTVEDILTQIFSTFCIGK